MGCPRNKVGMDENTDHLDDVRLARRCKRQSVDPQYYSFLNGLQGYSVDHSADDGGCGDDDGDCGDDEEIENDPQYDFFMNHLREAGTSYILNVAIDNAVSFLVKYEVDDDFKGKTLKNLNNVSCEAKAKTKQVLRSNIHEKKKETPVTLRTASSKKGVSSGDNAETKQVLQNRRHEEKEETPISLSSDSSRGRKRSVAERDAEAKCKDSASVKPGSKVHTTSKPESKQETVIEKVDESYANFLKFIKHDGETMMLMSKDGKQIRYESDDESLSDSDSEIVVTNKVPDCGEGKYTPFVVSKIFYSPRNGSNSEFREKLMDALRKPFDEKEYGLLMQEVSERKPVERDRELRGSVKTYSLEICSPSYLDQFTDFANRIDSVRHNRHKVLNLLRGFFFWLKNLTQEEAFKPWLDKQSMFEHTPRL